MMAIKRKRAYTEKELALFAEWRPHRATGNYPADKAESGEYNCRANATLLSPRSAALCGARFLLVWLSLAAW